MVVNRILMLVDGAFLAVLGVVQLVLELAGHSGVDMHADAFHNSPYTLGFVEAHGFAVIVALLFLLPARREPRRYWHLTAAFTHLLLGTANLVFWSSFTTFDMVVPGVLSTIAHGLFLLAQSWAWLTWPSDLGYGAGEAGSKSPEEHVPPGGQRRAG
jgi:hypothetical protein